MMLQVHQLHLFYYVDPKHYLKYTKKLHYFYIYLFFFQFVLCNYLRVFHVLYFKQNATKIIEVSI